MKVCIREKDKYYKVPIEALYTPEDVRENIVERTKLPIKSYKEIGNGRFRVAVLREYFKYVVRVRLPNMRDRWETYGYSSTERDKIEAMVDYLGGLQYKSKQGVEIQAEGTVNSRGQTVIEKETLEIRNGYDPNIRVDLPNLYVNGKICWGNVNVESQTGIDYIDILFHKYITSTFNGDLCIYKEINTGRVEEVLRDKYEKDYGNNSEIDEVRQIYINKLDMGSMYVGTVINLEISTIFDLDNVYLEYLIER